ncbi:hypothetical protein [Blattabacterium cuenoti]|uniref:hypothetical protein n=1 Tax=Blattabacterium cuenoti TaxID=1653831 RepID=UPI00163D1CAE|nr:hypothetical protein [Blattabacterium cuenoti]
MNKKKIVEKIIKNGEYLFIDPITSIFSKVNSEQNSSIHLIGTLVKKKYLKNQFIGIK